MNTAAWRNQEAEENRRLRRVMTRLLREAKFAPIAGQATQILDIACGECREAETLVKMVHEFQLYPNTDPVRFVGTDLRHREVDDAARRFKNSTDAKFEFFAEDASKLHRHREIGEQFDLAFIRHQNFWLDGTQWKRIFEQGLAKLNEDGLLVITSYFDREHERAQEAIAEAGGELVITERHAESMALSYPGKSVDRHVAVFRRKQ